MCTPCAPPSARGLLRFPLFVSAEARCCLARAPGLNKFSLHRPVIGQRVKTGYGMSNIVVPKKQGLNACPSAHFHIRPLTPILLPYIPPWSLRFVIKASGSQDDML